MMPDLRAPLRALGGRRVTGQIVVPTPGANGRVVQAAQALVRVTLVLTPMDPREIALLPEGQREWRYWTATGTSTVPLQLDWNVLPDNAPLIQYEVVSVAPWDQARIRTYGLVERRRPT